MMKYKEFIQHVYYGNEFEGTLDEHSLAVLNVIEDKVVVVINGEDTIIDEDDIENTKIYDDMTFEELFDNNRIVLTDMF